MNPRTRVSGAAPARCKPPANLAAAKEAFATAHLKRFGNLLEGAGLTPQAAAVMPVRPWPGRALTAFAIKKG